MRYLAMIAALAVPLALAACDDSSRITEPRVSNGNTLEVMECPKAAGDLTENVVCVDKEIRAKPVDGLRPVAPE